MFRARNLYILFYAVIGGLLLPSAAHAAQNTQVIPIGYSQEGRFFAYEEYGVDDNSKDAYSKIYVIDLVQVSQVVGTPVTYFSNLNEQTMLEIRLDARSQVDVYLDSLQFNTQAVLVAGYGDGHVGMDDLNSSLTFGVPIYGSNRRVSGKYQLILDIFETVAADDCKTLTDKPIVGLGLSIENFGAGREVYMDKVLPRSRGCPTDYEIYGVVLPFGATDISKSVGLISVTAQENDGANRHFLAIPLGFGLN